MDRDSQYDLLTAALLGAVIGAGAALLIGAAIPSEQERHPVRYAVRRGGTWARQRGSAIGEKLDPEALSGQMRDYMESARDSVADAMESELKELRRSIRRQRKRLGL